MMQRAGSTSPILLGIFALLSTGLTAGLGYTVQQQSFGELLLWYVPLYALYLWSLWKDWPERQVLLLFGVGILMRLVLFGALPGLSDDIYRFVWDGRLWVNGHNPFDFLPAHYMEEGITVPGITPELYAELNSPEYYTIYPPVAQLAFVLAAQLSPDSLLDAAVVLRSFLVLCEMGSLILIWHLLRHFRLPVQNGLIYALNPLIIVEITGNLHFEGAMVFFLLLAIWFLVRSKWALSALALALSVASKLLPLMFFPFLIRRLGWRRSYWYFPLAGAALITSFLPMLSARFVENFSQSLDLYFRKFEFNGSIYYLIRWLDYQWAGYNTIAHTGPQLALATLAGILLLTYREQETGWPQLPERMLWAVSLYLLLTTTVHPWYTTLPIVLCLFTRWRYPVLWSGLIMLTYINYSYPEYHENLWIVALEYGVLGGYFYWEFRKSDLQSG